MDLPRLRNTTFALDLETHDPWIDSHGPGWCFPNAGEVVGFAVAWGYPNVEARYLGTRHRGGGNLDAKAVERYIRDAVGDTSNTVVFHNRVYDEGWLRRIGIPVRAKAVDTTTAAPLINEYRRGYSLDSLALEYLDRRKNPAPLLAAVEAHNAEVKQQAKLNYALTPAERRAWLKTNLWKPKTDLYQMPATTVGEYAAPDADLTLNLWYNLKPFLNAEDLWPIFTLESALLPMLIEMRWRGVRVDMHKAEEAVASFTRREAELAKEIRRLVGFDVEVWTPGSLARAFDALGLGYLFTRKTNKPSFTKEFLKSVVHPVADLIRQQRVLSKTRGTFLQGYILDKSVAGRIHGQFHPLPHNDGGSVGGRFASSDPNLENLPSPEKDYEMGALVRGCYLPEEGELWCAADYSQQEPRLMVHFAAVARVKGAAAAVQAYRDNPRMDFHSFMATLTGLIRFRAKQIFLGRAYGMGGAKYCRSVGLPTKWIERDGRQVEVAGDEGQEQLDQFDQHAPFVRRLSKECERRAKRRGYIKTLLGRRCRFGRAGFIVEGRDFYYKAMNRLIQGSAADQTKKAMLDLWDSGTVPLVPVHDEIGVSVPSPEAAAVVAEVMENCTPLKVPCVVDVELGPSWGATVKVEE